MATKRKKPVRKRAAAKTPKKAPALTRFEADLLVRGEAEEPTADGTLSRGATHAIVKKPDGTVEFKRDKFKLV